MRDLAHSNRCLRAIGMHGAGRSFGICLNWFLFLFLFDVVVVVVVQVQIWRSG